MIPKYKGAAMTTRFEHFSAAIYGIYRDILKIQRDEMTKHHLKGSYALYLTALRHNPEGVTATQLCEICDKDKAAISRVISELEEKELVTRVSSNDTFYRAKLKLTEQGALIAAQVDRAAGIAVDMATKGMSPDDRRVMYECLGLIATNLRDICKNGIPEN